MQHQPTQQMQAARHCNTYLSAFPVLVGDDDAIRCACNALHTSTCNDGEGISGHNTRLEAGTWIVWPCHGQYWARCTRCLLQPQQCSSPKKAASFACLDGGADAAGDGAEDFSELGECKHRRDAV